MTSLARRAEVVWSRWRPRGSDRPGKAYLVAAVAAGAVVLLRLALGPLGEDVPLMPFVVAIMAAGWYGGLRPGLFATALSAFLGAWLFMSDVLHEPSEQTRIAIFLLVGVGISWVCGEMHRSQRKSESRREQLRTTLTSIGDAVVTTDGEGRVTAMNPVAMALTGYAQEEAAQRPIEHIFRIMNERTRLPIQNPVRQVLAEHKTVGLANHTLLVAKNGVERWIDDSAAPILDREGKPTGAVLIFRDISDRRRMELELAHVSAESERRRRLYETALGNTPDLMYVFDLEHRLTFANEVLLSAWGRPFHEAVGKRLHELGYPPLQAERFDVEIDRVIATRSPVRGEVTSTEHGSDRVYDYIFVPVVGEDGGVEAVAGTTRDITERKAAEEALRESDRRKTEFLAMLSHELRNPLAPIRNAVQMMRLAGGDGAPLDPAIEMIDRQVRQMVRLVDDLLDVSRITQGRIELRRAPVDLALVVNQAVEAASPYFRALDQALGVSLPPQPIHVRGDAARLAQLIGNLLNNASKFTSRGGRIRLVVEREGPDAVIRVQDTGIGIEPGALERIFELFTQADTSLERNQGGLGIGLALVRKLADMHEGIVEARSAGPGRGSEFIVRLPALDPATLTPDEPATTAAGTSTPRRRILVVDDNRDAATSLALVLGMDGHHVDVAHDGLAGVEAAAKLNPDVILLDIGLPKLHGYDAARRIREQPQNRHVVLVALTGWGQEDDRMRAKAAGFDAHLVKPVDPAALPGLLAEAERHRDATRGTADGH